MSPTRHEHRLVGVRPEPLAGYLKGLGLLRLVGTSEDRGATGHWANDGFVLETSLDDDELASFLLERYQPTPVLSPWNSSSGFGPEGAGELHAIESSNDSRLAPYREGIAAARRVIEESASNKWGKEQQIAAARAALPDAAVAWLDAAVVLTADDQLHLAYPPLLGTGGNLGRLEVSRNFHRRVLDVLGLAPPTRGRRPDPAAWLGDALWDLRRSVGLRGESPGQFDPGAMGGVNSGPVGPADQVLNPWDFVLLVEGAILFAGGSARRLSSAGSARVSAPFTVEASAEGYSSATGGEKGKGELWAPLWERPVTLPELRRLLAEGRADWRGRQARTGLDLAKAAGGLGVDRGITAFARYAFVERLGQSQAALPAGRVHVAEREARPSVMVLAELDPWLDRIRWASNPPAAVSAGLRAVDRAEFAVASGGGPKALANTLIEAARLETAVGRTGAFRRNADLPPLHGLDAARWVPALLGPETAERGPELRLAVSLASGRDVRPPGGGAVASLRTLLRPITYKEPGVPHWAEEAPVEGFGSRPLITVLAASHARRVVSLLATRRVEGDAGKGMATRWEAGIAAPLADVIALVSGDLDQSLLGDLVAACLLLDWGKERIAPLTSSRGFPIPPELSVVGPFYAGQPTRLDNTTWQTRLETTPLEPGTSWPALLAAGHAEPVLTAAIRRLQIAHLAPVVRSDALARTIDPDGARRLGTALFVPLSPRSRATMLEHACPDTELSPLQTATEESSNAPS